MRQEAKSAGVVSAWHIRTGCQTRGDVLARAAFDPVPIRRSLKIPDPFLEGARLSKEPDQRVGGNRKRWKLTETEQSKKFTHEMKRYLDIERNYRAATNEDKKKALIFEYLDVLKELCKLSFYKAFSNLGASAHVHGVIDAAAIALNDAIHSSHEDGTNLEKCECYETRH